MRYVLAFLALWLLCIPASAQNVNLNCLTGSAGINGPWLPASAANPCPVTATISPSGLPASTITTPAPTATTFSSVLAANSSRKNCLIQNTGTTLGYVYPGATGSATLTNAFQIAANGGTFSCASPNGTTLTDNIAATCASSTCAFVVNTN